MDIAAEQTKALVDSSECCSWLSSLHPFKVLSRQFLPQHREADVPTLHDQEARSGPGLRRRQRALLCHT